MRAQDVLFAIFAARATAASASSLNLNGDCNSGFVLCTPPGATSATTPQIGDAAFQNLFTDIVESSLPASKRSRSISDRAVASLCCNALLSCLTITALGLPMCYDKFTTNYLLPDGSFGTVVGGSYTSSTGDHANLETGDYTLANGTTGNIYSNDPAAKPNTATLPMPSQFTASGVGSAVPISNLGTQVTLTYTTTIPGSVVPPVTISPSTLSGTVSQETVLLPTTISTEIAGEAVLSTGAVTSLSTVTGSPSIIPGTTLPGSTANPVVTVVTTTEVHAILASGSSTASTTKKSAADRSRRFQGTITALCFVPLLALLLFLEC
ncbi:hypothetical protein NA56DRAFT_645616 [Hyaloscypha hepaticicola]|uniref:Uncharacterized protein n=1 Tax=Hyaloscypha hepaticicola TaxID=2082293 RepID=A0A2J6Q570_9HELO|nr:hypothetical protein NA56DRAFT_645616 [Hyaloscypha hepaticicola]